MPPSPTMDSQSWEPYSSRALLNNFCQWALLKEGGYQTRAEQRGPRHHFPGSCPSQQLRLCQLLPSAQQWADRGQEMRLWWIWPAFTELSKVKINTQEIVVERMKRYSVAVMKEKYSVSSQGQGESLHGVGGISWRKVGLGHTGSVRKGISSTWNSVSKVKERVWCRQRTLWLQWRILLGSSRKYTWINSVARDALIEGWCTRLRNWKFYLFISLFLFERQRDIWKQMFHSLIHSTNAHNFQGWVQPKPGAWTLI